MIRRGLKPKPRRRPPSCCALPKGSALICLLPCCRRSASQALLQIPRDAKTEARVGCVDRRRRAPGTARLRRRARPRAAADHLRAAAGVEPGGGVLWRAAVAIMPAIGDPFADVA